MSESKVYFGKTQVSPEEKTERVNEVFDAVATRYDIMNDLMSMGTHRLLKRVLVESASLRPGSHVLDVASGTGDVAVLLAQAVQSKGQVTALDLNEAMLREGRDRALNAGYLNIQHLVGNAERLPFADNSFRAVTIAFGIRNIARKEKALAEFKRVLVPGGRVVILEFSKPEHQSLRLAFDLFKGTWPLVGQLVTGSAHSYQYLVDSIDTHTPQDVLALMLQDSDYKDIEYDNLLGGIVAMHRGTA